LRLSGALTHVAPSCVLLGLLMNYPPGGNNSEKRSSPRWCLLKYRLLLCL